MKKQLQAASHFRCDPLIDAVTALWLDSLVFGVMIPIPLGLGCSEQAVFFRKRKRTGLPTLVYKSAEAFFDEQCEFGQTDIQIGRGVVAIILDAAKEFGTLQAVKRETDGHQTVVIRVASRDGGFVVVAKTPSAKGPDLRPGDLVMWVPVAWAAEAAENLAEKRMAWVGFIRCTLAPEMRNGGFAILSRFN